MTEGEMFEKSFERPANFLSLSAEEKWAIDKSLGILDWEGGCSHNAVCCQECLKRLKEHYAARN